MAEFSIHTLGCGSAKPTLRHQPSCTVVDFRNNLFMVDCGEGSQLAFMRQRMKFSRLGNIFLTHLHGDHVLGLPGLISTLDLHSTGGNLTIHTTAEGEKILRDVFRHFAQFIDFRIDYNILNPKGGEIAFENKSLTVKTVRLEHRVNALGYVFEEKPRLRPLRRDVCDYHNIPVFAFNNIKEGEDYVKSDGTVIPNSHLTLPPPPTLSYAHISDTAFSKRIAGEIGHPTLLFHETTYLEKDISYAAPRGHSTARQAGEVARLSGAKWLLTGHYSSRYDNDELFRQEAMQIFPNVITNKEGLVTDLTKL